MTEPTQKCPKCSFLRPVSDFRAPDGKRLRSCASCRKTVATLRNPGRPCPGLPKSWGYGKCKNRATSKYRCEDCTEIWHKRHRVSGDMDDSGMPGGQMYRGPSGTWKVG